MVLILPTVILELVLARAIYHVTNFGNLFSVFVLALAGIGSFASLGLIVASVTNTMQETQIINQLLWFALLFLSGATVPLPNLPKVAQHVALFLPATYLVSGLQRAMVDRASVFGRCGRRSGAWWFGPRWRFLFLRSFSGGNQKRSCRGMRSCGQLRRYFRLYCWGFGRTTTESYWRVQLP